jgi:DNA-binding GntR family transcriptional regulator
MQMNEKTPRVSALALSLPEQIADRIAEDILEERYPPGTRLKEVELAGAFGVSRMPVRDALRLLETQRLVRLVPQKGAVVVSLSIDELSELFEIRAALMGLSVRRLAERGSAQDVAQLQARLAEVAALARAGDLALFTRQVGQLGLLAAELAGPGWTHDFLFTTIRLTVKYSRRGLYSGEAAVEITDRWRAIVEAIAAHDSDRAEAAAKALMDSAWTLARPTLEAIATQP